MCLGLSWSFFGASWVSSKLLESFWGRPWLGGTFIFENERFISAGARLLKPVRAKTGSELLEGAYAFAWDGRESWEGVRADETKS